MNVSLGFVVANWLTRDILFQIIAAARIKIHSSPFGGDVSPEECVPIYAGQPISGILSIRISLHWADQESKRQKYTLRYDIEERIKDWLVCGRKRGEFVAQVSTMNVSIFNNATCIIYVNTGRRDFQCPFDFNSTASRRIDPSQSRCQAITVCRRWHDNKCIAQY